MAYVDRQSGTQRAASLATATIIQGAIGAVLVYGLAAEYLLPPKDQHLIVNNFRTPPPPPPCPTTSCATGGSPPTTTTSRAWSVVAWGPSHARSATAPARP